MEKGAYEGECGVHRTGSFSLSLLHLYNPSTFNRLSNLVRIFFKLKYDFYISIQYNTQILSILCDEFFFSLFRNVDFFFT